MKGFGYMVLGAWIALLLFIDVFYVILGVIGDAPARAVALIYTVITTALIVDIFNRKRGENIDN